MPMSIDDLAKKMNDAIAAKDKDGKPIEPTKEMKAYAEAVITSYNASLVNHAPGTVTATGVNGAPIADGAAMAGIVTGLLAPTWLAILTKGFGPAPNLALEATLSTTYLMASGLVNFDSGSITGVCTSTPVSTGILAAGAGVGGYIQGLSGSAWNGALAAITQGAPLGEPIYKAIADYIMENAEVTYATGTVTGTFAVGGGPMAAGAGVGGTVA